MKDNVSPVFNMQCYTHQTSHDADDVTAVEYPVEVRVGELVYCVVTVRRDDVWDQRLQLIVPECSFTTTTPQPRNDHNNNDNTSSRTYRIIEDKCVSR